MAESEARTLPKYRIGDAAKALETTADTLRYYERCGLVKAARGAGGVRVYSDQDISRLKFIRRAKAMKFTLDEVGQLLQLRDDPRRARDEVRALASCKLDEIERNVYELNTLRNELTLLVNLCRSAEEGCPILERMEETGQRSSGRSIKKNE